MGHRWPEEGSLPVWTADLQWIWEEEEKGGFLTAVSVDRCLGQTFSLWWIFDRSRWLWAAVVGWIFVALGERCWMKSMWLWVWPMLELLVCSFVVFAWMVMRLWFGFMKLWIQKQLPIDSNGCLAMFLLYWFGRVGIQMSFHLTMRRFARYDWRTNVFSSFGGSRMFAVEDTESIVLFRLRCPVNQCFG